MYSPEGCGGTPVNTVNASGPAARVTGGRTSGVATTVPELDVVCVTHELLVREIVSEHYALTRTLTHTLSPESRGIRIDDIALYLSLSLSLLYTHPHTLSHTHMKQSLTLSSVNVLQCSSDVRVAAGSCG